MENRIKLLDKTFRVMIPAEEIDKAVLVLLGGLMFYLAINKSAREVMERKLFF